MSSAAREAATPPCSPPPLPPELPEPVPPLPPPSGPAGVRGSVGTGDAGAPPVPVPAGAVDGDSGALPSAAAAALAAPPAAAAAALPARDLDMACGPEASLLGVPVIAVGVRIVVDVTGEALLTGTRIPVTVVPADGGGMRVMEVTTCVTADTTGAAAPVTGASV
jgi:hypothetical protein